jgi:hypothetical protein
MASTQEVRIDTVLNTGDLRRQFQALLDAFDGMRQANLKLMESCRGALDALDAIEAERARRPETPE